MVSGVAHRGGRIAHRVGAGVDGDAAEVLAPARRTRADSATPTRCSRRRRRWSPAAAPPNPAPRPLLRRNGSLAAERENIGPRTGAWYARTTSHCPLYTAPTAATSWFTNGICGFANQVISGMPSADCTAAAEGVEPTMPSTSAAVDPVSRQAATQASSASDAALTSPPSREKPVVAALAIATRSLAGLRDEIMASRSSRGGTPGPGTPRGRASRASTGAPITMSSLAAPTTVLGEAQPRLLLELDGHDRIGRRVVDARRRRSLVEVDGHEDRAAPAHRGRDDVGGPARRADRCGRCVPRAAVGAAHDPQLVVEACPEHGLVVVVE